MNKNLTPGVETVRVHAPVSAGSTDVTDCTVIDMLGREGVRFIVGFGTLTASTVTSISAQHSDAISSPTALDGGEDIEGSDVALVQAEDSSTIAILELVEPTKRYVQLQINRAVANAVVEFALAEVFNAAREPVPQHATVSHHKIVVTPVDGTP